MRMEGNHVTGLARACPAPQEAVRVPWCLEFLHEWCGGWFWVRSSHQASLALTGGVFTFPSSYMRSQWWVRAWSIAFGVRWGFTVRLTCRSCIFINYVALWTYFPRSKLSELLWEKALMPWSHEVLYLTRWRDSVMPPFLPTWSSYCRIIACERNGWGSSLIRGGIDTKGGIVTYLKA